MKKIISLIITSLFVPALLFGADDIKVNEDEMFSNPDSVVDTKKEEKKSEDDQKKKIGLSGELLSVNQYTRRSDAGEVPGMETSSFTPYMMGTLFADIRLPSDVKGFGAFATVHDASRSETTFAVKELFVDFNIGRAVYFRTGKQVLQWGRCYLWNPTDLINIQKQTFVTRIEPREGTYGLKVHAPFGTKANLYGFANMYQTDKVREIAGAGKLEFLMGGTEMAFSAWGREGYHPVYGYDFSTRVLGVDIVGEASLSRGSNTWKVEETGGVITAARDDRAWTGRACLDFGRGFDFNNQPKKIQVNLEVFYNGEGYGENLFRDKGVYAYDKPVTITVDGKPQTFPAGPKALYLMGNNLYEMNYYSPWYAALFTTVNKFFTSDFAWKINLIGNIMQRSFIASTGLSYANINDFKAGIEVYGFFGRKDTEYTLGGNSVMVLLTAGILF